MNCREHEADIVDLARGAGVSVEVDARLRAHLEACARCAARFAREQRLTAALSEVAGSAQEPSRSEAIESHLLEAFAAQHAAGSRETAPARAHAARWPAWGWLAAAALLVLAAAVWRGTASWRSPDAGQRASAIVAGAPETTAPAPVEAAASAPQRAEAAVPSPGRVVQPQAVPVPARAARGTLAPAAPAGEPEVLRFVSLPTAIGLPELESGRIVRVELATAVLPAFGFDVVPAPESGVVQADVLVGQDDQPRAIRFVNLKTDSRRRQ